jgi:hypothetical protein
MLFMLTHGSGDAKANWSSIEATYEVRSSQAETALSDLKGSEDAKAKVEVKQNMLHYKQEYKRRCKLQRQVLNN